MNQQSIKGLGLTCIAACTSLLAGAQSPKNLVTTMGSVTKVSVDHQTVRAYTTQGQAAISVYGPGIVRVRINPGAPGADFSYAVVAPPQPTPVKIEQKPLSIDIYTDSLHIAVKKNPFSIVFLSLKGDTINADEPGLTTSWIGQDITTYKHLQDGERFIGLGEKTGDLDRKGNGYVNWNADYFGYSIIQDPLYSSIPFYMGLHHGLNYGIFLDNTYQTTFNFGASNNRFSSFGATGGDMNYYFIYHTRLADIITDYTALTGRMPLPPLWSLGYQQNRYSYFPDTEVLRIASTLREKHIPADGITLDIHYMDAYKLFTWNKERFPDPQALTRKLKSMGLKLTVIVDPGIKVEKGYPAYESGMQNDIFLKYPDGTNYTAKVWPGWCHFPDFTNPKGRAWWSGQIQTYINQGVSGIWNDMNEISTWGQQVPENVLYNYDGQGATHLQGHNVYALEMVRASYEGAKSAGQRPFLLTRSGFAGLQRYSAIWTGDNRAEESHYFTGIRMLQSLGLSGVAFTGMDIGGFTGNPPANLFARWMELGAFIPYYRNHTQINSRSSEPWTYGEDIEEISRDYVSLRYRLLPYLYSIFYEATQDGLPVLRSLAIDYTQDTLVYAPEFQDQYLFGPSLLVAPVGADQGFAKVYLPEGNWYNLYTGAPDTGRQQKIIPLSLDKLPVYVKGGSIIPEQSLVQSTAQIPVDTLWLHLYKGSQDGDFSYYEDDGNSFAYQKGDFYLRKMHYDAMGGAFQLEAPQGSRASRFHHLQLVLHGFDDLHQVTVNGASLLAKASTWDFLPAPTFQDPALLNVAKSQAGCPVKTIDIDNVNTIIKVKF